MPDLIAAVHESSRLAKLAELQLLHEVLTTKQSRQAYLAELQLIHDVLKFNPNHDELGRFAESDGSGGSIFVSPNTGNLSFNQAVLGLGSAHHAAALRRLAEIDKELGLDSKVSSVVGAWSDGAENSTMSVVKGADWDKLELSAAMKGLETNQKAVLLFQDTGEGDALLSSFDAKGSLDDIHKTLLDKGVQFHTLEPTDGGVRVHVYGNDKAALADLRKVAHGFGSTLETRIGKGEFLGTTKEDGTDAEQRADAREIYSRVIGRRVPRYQVSAAKRRRGDDRDRRAVESQAQRLAKAWSEAAREAALEARRAHAKGPEPATGRRRGVQEAVHDEVEHAKQAIKWAKQAGPLKVISHIAQNPTVGKVLGSAVSSLITMAGGSGFSDPIMEQSISVQVQNLATSMSVTEGIAREHLTTAFKKLRELRIMAFGKAAAPHDPVLAILDKVIAALELHKQNIKKFNPNHDERGRFSAGEGVDALLDDNPTNSIYEGSPSKEVKLNPEVTDVGGDDWNRATAVRLEKEYESAKPALDKITDTVGSGKAGDILVEHGEDEEPETAPTSWEELSNDKQEQIFEKWKESTYNEFLESEQQSYYDNGDGAKDQRWKLFDEYQNASETPDWLGDTIKEFRDESAKEIPYTDEQILAGLNISYDRDSDYGSKKNDGLDIEVAVNEFGTPTDLPYDPERQAHFEGIEPPEPSLSRFPKEMQDELADKLRSAFNDAAEKIDVEPPDYLAENVAEYQDSVWPDMADHQKMTWAKDNDMIENYDVAVPAAADVRVPWVFDPMAERASGISSSSGPSDYKDTQVFARYMSQQRTADLLVERGLVEDRDDAVSYVRNMDSRLWADWKSDSTSNGGKLLQLATAEELGGRLNYSHMADFDRDSIIKNANRDFYDAGGYDGIKSYIRGKWETTQYLLDKADRQTVDVYRGISKKLDDTEPKLDGSTEGGYGGDYVKLPQAKIDRNGAASFTINPKVANDWKKGTTNSVVVRARVPRTAIVSVPAYGQNVFNEQEVVVAGTAWKKWDAWRRHAPTTDRVAFKRAAL